MRLFLAGVTQTLRSEFTAGQIFDLHDPKALAILRELGFANLAMGTLGLASLAEPVWVGLAAIVGGLYYGLAALGYLLRKGAELQGADGARLRPRHLPLARHLRRQPLRLKSQRIGA